MPVIFSKILKVKDTKMKKIQKNYERNAGESFRLDKNGLHGVTAQGRIKMSLLLVLEEKHLQNAEDRRLSGMEGGRSFLFKTGKYWNGKGRNIPYKWRFKSRNLAQRPKLRLGCLTKRR